MLLYFIGQFRNAPIGNVHSEDADDWDIGDKTFTFDGTPPKFFRFGEISATKILSASYLYKNDHDDLYLYKNDHDDFLVLLLG